MEQVGCLSALIALFALMGSYFTGACSQSAPTATATAPSIVIQVSPSPEILEDRAEALGQPLTRELAERLLGESLDVLKLRFPDGEVTFGEVGPRSVRRIQIRTDQDLTDEQIERLAVSSGEFRLEIKANAADAQRLGCDLAEELARAQAWLDEDGARTVTQYNRLKPEAGGPTKGLRMALMPPTEDAGSAGTRELMAVAIEEDPEWRFQRDDMSRFYLSRDMNDHPAMGFDVAEGRQEAFGAFTGAHVGEQLAVVMDDRVLTAPNLNGALGAGGIITGGGDGFEESEVERMVTLLTLPRLPMPLVMHMIARY